MPTSRTEAPRLFAITWPILSEHVLHSLVGLVFVWLTTRISDGTAAAFGISNQLMVTCLMLFRLIGTGASVVVTQYLGASEPASAERIAKASLGGASFMGLAVGLAVLSGADPLLRLMKLPADLRPEAVPYLMMLGGVLFADSVIATMASIMRAYTRTRETMRLILSMNALALLVGLPLMFGFQGLPKLGLLGVGTGYLVSRVWAFTWLVRAWRGVLGIRIAPSDFWRVRGESLREMLHIGLPGAGENVVYRVSFTMILSLVAGMGTSALVTYTYMFQIIHFVLLAGMSIGFGTEIVVGHMIGAGQLTSADRLVRRALATGLVTSIGLGLTVALFGRQLMEFFTRDPEVIERGARLAWLVLLVEPGRSFNVIVINALRATGDVRFPVFAGMVSMYAVALGLAWFLGVHLGYGLFGVWIGFAADEWLRGLSMYVRWRRRAWVKYARRARRRIVFARKSAASSAELVETPSPALTGA